MQRIYLHLHESGSVLQDAEGCDVHDLEQARILAIDAARSLMSADVMRGRLTLGSGIEIADSGGNPLAFIRFRDAITVEGI